VLALHSKGQWFDPRQKRLFIWMKIHGLTQNLRLRSEWLEQMPGNNECCSAPSARLVRTYVKDIYHEAQKKQKKQ